MEFTSILTRDCVSSVVPCSSKKRVLEYVSELAAKRLPLLDVRTIFESLLAREKLGSTGIGNGIALPHGRLTAGIDQAVGVLVKCTEGVEFNAIDNRPVDLVFALLVPEEDCKFHLKTLATVAERLSDKQLLKQLRSATSDDELYQIMINK